jgi:hypothetical protein
VRNHWRQQPGLYKSGRSRWDSSSLDVSGRPVAFFFGSNKIVSPRLNGRPLVVSVSADRAERTSGSLHTALFFPFFLSSLFLSESPNIWRKSMLSAFEDPCEEICRKVIATLYHTALSLSVRHDKRPRTPLGAINNEQGLMKPRRQNAQCCKMQEMRTLKQWSPSVKPITSWLHGKDFSVLSYDVQRTLQLTTYFDLLH